MKQYLLSVHSVEGEPTPSPEVMEQAYRDVEAFNAQLRAAGAWVFAGGLHPVSTATVVRLRDGEVIITDGPFAETKEHSVASGSSRPPTSIVACPPPRGLVMLHQARQLSRGGPDDRGVRAEWACV